MATLTIDGVAEALTTHWNRSSADELADFCAAHGVEFEYDLDGRVTWIWRGNSFQFDDTYEKVVWLSELDKWFMPETTASLLDRMLD